MVGHSEGCSACRERLERLGRDRLTRGREATIATMACIPRGDAELPATEIQDREASLGGANVGETVDPARSIYGGSTPARLRAGPSPA